MASKNDPGSSTLCMPRTVLWKGYLYKRQRGRSHNAHLGRLRFQRRYCSLTQDKLEYFATDKETVSKGMFLVKDITIVERVPDVTFSKHYCFEIGNKVEMMYFAAKSESERGVWIETLRIATSVNKNKMLKRYHTGAFGQVDNQKWSCCDRPKDSPGCRKSTFNVRNKSASLPYLTDPYYDFELSCPDHHNLSELHPDISTSLPEFAPVFEETAFFESKSGLYWTNDDELSESYFEMEKQSLCGGASHDDLGEHDDLSELPFTLPSNGQRPPSPLRRSLNPYANGYWSPTPQSIKKQRKSSSPNPFTQDDQDPQTSRHSPRFHSHKLQSSTPRSKVKRSQSHGLTNTSSSSSQIQYIGCNLLIYKKKSIGSGAFGCVFKGKFQQQDCAVKVLNPLGMEITSSLPAASSTVQTESLERFKRECEFLESLEHKNIVRHFATLTHPESSLPVLVLELLNCNLGQYISECSLPNSTQFSFCGDVASAMEFLHQKNIVHRDLCGDNVLIKLAQHHSTPVAKVTDFGMSRIIDCKSMSNTLTAMGHRGGYLPPEASLISSTRYDSSLDVFMYGVVMTQIVTSTPHVKDVEERIKLIAQIDDTHPLKNIILQCIDKERHKRPCMTDICRQISVLI